MNDCNSDQDGLSAQVAILNSAGAVTAGSTAWREFLEAGPQAASAAAGIQAVLTGETSLFVLEYSCPAGDRWYTLRVSRFPGDGPVQAVALQEDITGRKQAEEALRRRVEELDQFAYVTSHDLKAPLRGIANLSRWIEEDLEGSILIPPEVAGQFDLLRGRVSRMEAMIEAILQYSRIDRTEIPSETVDVKGLLTEVIDLLNPPTRIAISMDDRMPLLHTPRLRLYQVFQNLLSNSIKHHDRPHGIIHVGAQVRGDWVEFSVADDGPGIAPKFQERIWVIFQTLEARDKVENTGVGLALVKKIVEGQGGTVSVESQEGQGATFKFTWPHSQLDC